jgi:hypothetical protein
MPILIKRVNSLVKLGSKSLMEIGVVVLALLPANRAQLMGTFLNVITSVPNRNVTHREQNVGQRPENWMQSATCRQT